MSRTRTALALLLAACSSAPPADPPEPFADQAPEVRRRRGEEPVLEGAPVEPAPSSSASPAPAPSASNAFRGTAATTNSFGFGGDPYACNWQITMKSLVLEVHADAASGEVHSATFTARAVEETLPPCEATPYPPHEHVYTMATATVLAPRMTRVTLTPKSTNEPDASATIEIDLSKTPGTASIEIHRTDQAPPLDWTVKAKLTLERP